MDRQRKSAYRRVPARKAISHSSGLSDARLYLGEARDFSHGSTSQEKYENLLIDFHGLELLLKEHEEHIYLGTELKNDIKNAEEKIRNMSIQDVELSMRSANGLYRSELFTVGAVADYINSGKNLLELKNIGKRSKNEIIEKIKELKLYHPEK